MPPLSAIAWRKAPFARLLLFLVAGISLALYAKLPVFHYLPLSLATGLVVLLILHLYARHFGQRWLFGTFLAFWVFSLGYWRVQELADANLPNHFSLAVPPDSLAVLSGKVIDRQLSRDRLRLGMVIEKVGLPGQQLKPVSGQMLVYLPLDHRSDSLFPGSRIIWQGSFQRLVPPLNPLAFDFSAYQARQNRYYQSRIDSSTWQLIRKPAFSLIGIALEARHQMLRVFRRHLPTANELAVGTALVLGSREDMQRSVQNAYTQTGAIHVLAVSGLHVGIVAMGLQWLLALFPFAWPGKRWVLLLLNLVGIWGFALLTGMSPSVQRSAVMFSLIMLGQTFERPHQIFNTLAGSAFLLLLYNPWLLLDVGFQLSYLAVAGIVLFHNTIYTWLYFPQKWADYCWNLTAVGIAAQLATFPLSLYYFHQFPVYFWLSGLMVVPVSPFILGLGIILLAVGTVPLVGTALGFVFYGLIWAMNAGIFWLNSLPGGIIPNLWISPLELTLLYVVIIALALLAETKRPFWILTSLGALALALGLAAVTSWDRQNQQAMVVYHVPKATVIDWYSGKERYSLSTLPKYSTALDFATAGYRSFRGAAPAVSLDRIDTLASGQYWHYQSGLVLHHNRSLVLLQEAPDTAIPDAPKPVDVVLVSGSPKLSLADCEPYYQAKHWVFDGSNSPYKVRAWLKECTELGLPCHATGLQGAFKMEGASL